MDFEKIHFPFFNNTNNYKLNVIDYKFIDLSKILKHFHMCMAWQNINGKKINFENKIMALPHSFHFPFCPNTA